MAVAVEPQIAERLAPVLATAAASAAAVDRAGEFPAEAVAALRESGMLGLTLPVEVGGLGARPEQFVEVLEALAGSCASTAMIYLMHVASAAPIAAARPTAHPDLAAGMASGKLLGSLAFSERGSRSHFWAPVSMLQPAPGGQRLVAQKSWVTSAGHADVYVLSVGVGSGSELYAVEAARPGLGLGSSWDGLGLRGNASAPVDVDVVVTDGDRIGGPEEGFRLMMEVVLPWFNLGSAAVSLGVARAALDASISHCGGARLAHLDQSLADLPTVRARLAQMRLSLDVNRAYLYEAARSVASPGDDTMLRVLGVKAAANDAALAITEDAMRVCGGAAFSKHLSVERNFRDARAGAVMAPTADILYDFVGKAITGLPLF